MAETGLALAQPTLSVDGEDNLPLSDGLKELLIVETTEGLYRCEALFVNWGTRDNMFTPLYFDRATLDFGKSFAVRLAQEDDPIFEGRITGLEAFFLEGGSLNMNVLAEDRLQDLRMTRRTRTFANGDGERITDAEVFRQIASEHGLQEAIDVPEVQHPVLAQVNQSDLAFLRARARALNAEVWVDGDTLHITRRENRGSPPPLEMTYQRELYEFAVLADLAEQRSAVIVSGWDPLNKAKVEYEATQSAIQGELDGGLSGASILEEKFAARKETIVRTAPITQQAAEREATAYFQAQARRFVTGTGVSRVNRRLRVGVTVDLKELGPLFSGEYYVTEVRHMFDRQRGIRTEFYVERPGLGRP
jgi:phage protein D